MEEWKAIQGTNGKIEVSRSGLIRSLLRGEPKVLKAQEDSKGYLRIKVTLNGKGITYKVHREVAKAFIDNPDNLPQVNHKDGNKHNNDVQNLEWITNAENAHHAIANGLWNSVIEGAKKENESRKRPIKAYSLDGDDQKVFGSIADAERFFGSRHISDVLKGKRSMCKGHTFRYLEGGDACAELDYR